MNFLDFSPVDTYELPQARLSILPQQLFLAKITKDQLCSKLQTLLQLIFLAESSSNFLSYTETNDEVSLTINLQILDKTSLEFLGDSSSFTVSKQYYRAIQIYEGEDAIEQPGYVHHFTLPLTRAGIPIIYLSTFNTDIIFVEENKLDRAYRILQELFPKVFPTESASPKPITNLSFKNDNTNKLRNFHFGGSPKALELTQLPNKLSLASFPRSRIPDFSFCLLKLLLTQRSSESEHFVSVTLTNDEVSLVVETTDLEQLPTKFVSEFRRNSKSWKAIQISAGVFGFAGLGAVGKISEILANHNITLYYLSTFDDDFILVPENNVNDAIKFLQSEDNNNQLPQSQNHETNHKESGTK